MGIANYVLRRGKFFVWRRRLPGIGTVQVALRTDDPRRARRIAGLVTAESLRISADMSTHRLTAAEAKGLFDRVVREETARLINGAPFFPTQDSELAQWAVQARIAGQALLSALREGEISAEDEALMSDLGYAADDMGSRAVAAWNAFVEMSGRAAEPLRAAYARERAERVVASFLRLPEPIDPDQLLAAYRVILAGQAAAILPRQGISMATAEHLRAADDLDPSRRKLPAEWLTDEAEKNTPPAAPAAVAQEPAYDPSWMSVVERIVAIQVRDGVKPAQQQLTRSSAKLFADATGVVDVREVRQAHLAQFRDALRNLPTAYGKSTKDAGLSVARLIERAADLPSSERGLSPLTTNRHLRIVKSVLTKAASEGLPVAQHLDFKVLRAKDPVRKRKKRLSFTIDEVQQIFRHPVWQGHHSAKDRRTPGKIVTKDGLYWIPLLAVYTGARREDIAALMVSDVQTVDGIPALYIRENDNRRGLKSAATERVVPLHPHLIELGFMDHVAGQGGNAFPELTRKSPNAGLGASKAYMIDRILDDQLGGERGGKSFYSFRHYVTQQLRVNGTQKEVRLDILGHEGADLEDTVYGDDMPVAMKFEAIAKLPQVF